MEGYHSSSYPKYNSEPHPHNQQFMHVGYPGANSIPVMNSAPNPHMQHPASPYSFMSHPASKQSPPYHPRHPQYYQQQQQQQQHYQPPTTSSRVVTEPSCSVYRSSQHGDQITHTARQIIAADGKLFIEHIPGHNVIFAPIEVSISSAMHRHSSPISRVVKPRLRATPTLSRPSNVFFKYRSVKQRELQEKHPRLNQTVISRMVAEHWKREPDELKQRYKDQYKEEMKKYEISKKLRRTRPDYEYVESDEVTNRSDSTATYFQSGLDVSVPFVQEPQNIDNARGDISARHRSFTMPANEGQLEISRLIH
ncbi:hypothetical protein H4R24_003015 [Coemansia sp. RSA 988]|nr:hypothetical protein H4R24_003015 [Coemansia sp. RSA 988]